MKVCSDGYYGNIFTKLCTECDKACTKCYGPTNDLCTECGTGYNLNETSCVTTCPEGTFKNQNICTKCADFAATCTGELNATSCINKFYLLEGSC